MSSPDADRQLLEELEALAADERASLDAAARLDVAPGRAEAALRASVLGAAPATLTSPARGTGRGRPLAMLVAAAAVVLLTLVLAVTRNGVTPDDGARVLGDEAGPLHPRGVVERFTPFRWDVELPEGGHFVVRVEGEGLALESGWLDAQEWTPEEEPAWPARIRWTLEVYRASGPGDLVASYVAWAER